MRVGVKWEMEPRQLRLSQPSRFFKVWEEYERDESRLGYLTRIFFHQYDSIERVMCFSTSLKLFSHFSQVPSVSQSTIFTKNLAMLAVCDTASLMQRFRENDELRAADPRFESLPSGEKQKDSPRALRPEPPSCSAYSR